MYGGLISAIPKEWKTKIKDDYDISALADEPIHIENLNSKTKTSKLFYSKFLEIYLKNLSKEKTTPTAISRWGECLWVKSDISWEVVYSIPSSVTKGSKLIEFQLLVNHKALYTNSKLLKTGTLASERCTFCFYCRETIEHLLYFCEISKSVWIRFFEIIRNNTEFNLSCEPNLVLFGFLDLSEKYSALNLLIILVKRYLYVCRCRENMPSNVGLTNFLKHNISIDLCSNKRESKKWEKFENCSFYP